MLILGAGIWFVSLQLIKVGVCPHCMTAHASGIAAALLLLAPAARPGGAGEGLFARAGYVAAAALAVLFLGQFVHAPKTGRESRDFAVGSNAQAFLAAQAARAKTNGAQTSIAPVQTHASSNTAPVPATNVPLAATTNVPSAPLTNITPLQVFTPGMKPVEGMRRPFKSYGGLVALDLTEVPLLGSVTNAHAIVSLFDYTCHHCRLMHPVLTEVQNTFKDRLSIISLPMPLDPKCNHTVTQTHPDHSNACAYAHVALAMFRADRAKHHEFDEWLFTGERPPPMAQAVMRAAGLVGTNVLAQALRDPWVAEQIRFDVALYEIAYRQQHGAMPQFIIGNTVIEGTYSREQIIKMLDEHLGLKQTP
jgi:predicted DsbA family dithiol-disulfide isomerase